MNKTKQIIILRKDLNMRKGKMVAQGSHASMAAILNVMKPIGTSLVLQKHLYPAAQEWLEGSFTKVCVSVNSEEELVACFDQALKAGLLTALITDSGLTEFNGVPTRTAVAIGPAYSDELDPITGHLPLL